MDLKNQEIDELKNKIEKYNQNLNENEKLLEENKKMILYLNKNLNDITNAPFKKRFGQDYYNNKISTINYGISNSNEFNDNNNALDNNLKNDDFGNIESNYYRNTYYLKNINVLNNDDEDEGMIILPVTNLCNYHVSGNLGGVMNKYMIKNDDKSIEEKKLLLELKYGNSSSNDKNKNENLGKRNTYNIEEEFPNKFKP